MNLRLRTEHSFGYAIGKVDKVLSATSTPWAGIADRHGTWGHIRWMRACKAAGRKPIFGVELAVVHDMELREKQQVNYMSFIARNDAGLREVYELTTLATSKFYYHPRLDYGHLAEVSDNVIVLSGAHPDFERLPMKPNIFVELNQLSSPDIVQATSLGKLVATGDNLYPRPSDKGAYDIIVGKDRQMRTASAHIISEHEWLESWPEHRQAIALGASLASECTAALPKAQLLHPDMKVTLQDMCIAGAKSRKVNLDNKVYGDRLDRELKLIEDKEFEDYFFIVADLVNWAKQRMLVGPARGSSCGSLVCYLIGITDIDPIPYDLLFERFIDINRKDLPDIDIDFQDDRRELAFDYLKEKYGHENVARLGTINVFKAKSALGDCAKELGIPQWEVADLKDSIIERSTGDSRAAFCILDTFEQLEIGRSTLQKYPELAVSAELEGCARHTGMHAAGIIITANPITNYCSVNEHTQTAMIDKYDAEDLNLLKIDALGLRTLSVLQDTLDQIGRSREWLRDLPTDNAEAFETLNKCHFAGIFQFEGYALQSIVKQMHIDNFEDIVSITALARPGPLNSGGTTEFLKRRTGESETVYLHPLAEDITKITFGVIVYQEQVMQIARIVGSLSWEDVSSLRKAMSKSLGKEFFDRYFEKFAKGTDEKGIPREQAQAIWDKINTMGSWAFNRCLSGDTMIRLSTSGSNLPTEISIAELYDRYVANPSSWIKQRKKKGFCAPLITFDGERGVPMSCVTIHRNGIKKVNRYLFDDGTFVDCTKDHKFLINGQWTQASCAKVGDRFRALTSDEQPKDPKMAVAKDSDKGKSARGRKYGKTQEGFPTGKDNPAWKNGLSVAFRKFKLANKGKPCQVCGRKTGRMEVHHKDESSGNINPEDLQWLCVSCHKKEHYMLGRTRRWKKGYKPTDKVLVSVTPIGDRETYDIEMPDPHHNFMLANGLITHNSHAVAYGLMSYWCSFMKAHHPLEFAASCLRNAKDDDQSIKILRELVNEGYHYKPLDKDKSVANWSVQDGTLVGGRTAIKGVGTKLAETILRKRTEGKPFTERERKLLTEGTTPWDKVFEASERWGHIIRNPEKFNILTPLTLLKDITQHSDGTFVFIAKITEKNLRDHNELQNLVKRGGKRMEGQSLFLNLTLEDDTDSMMASVNRFDYLKWGVPLIESGKIGDWYIWKGVNNPGFRKIRISRWRKLTGNEEFTRKD